MIASSVLGWVPGIITMVVSGVLFWITSMTLHKFIMKYPQIRDICELATINVYIAMSRTNCLANR
jgi:amino acid permease